MHTSHRDEARRQARHAVHLYSTEAGLVQYVVALLARPLLEAEPVLVIATAAHRREFADALTRGGLDVLQLQRAGLYQDLDAHEVVRACCVEGRIDAPAFQDAVGDRVGMLAGRHGTFQLYAEVVSLIWASGDTASGLRLERLWNDLADTAPFRLSCGYPTGILGAGESTGDVEAMFREHEELALA